MKKEYFGTHLVPLPAYQMISIDPNGRGELFRAIQIRSSAHKSSSYAAINSRGAPATIRGTLARIHPRLVAQEARTRKSKDGGGRGMSMQGGDFSISYSLVRRKCRNRVIHAFPEYLLE